MMAPEYKYDGLPFPNLIGIAGNIGSGKSVVSRILRCNGFSVYDCDREASVLMNEDSLLKQSLVGILGNECYLNDGSLNKPYVSEKIFDNVILRNEVNHLVHEAVRQDLVNFVISSHDKVFVESAIMATSGLDQLCDKIWVIDASEYVRMRRVMLRNKMPETEVRKRMDAQRHEISKLPSDKIVIIENDDTSKVLERVLTLAMPDTKFLEFEFLAC